MTDDKKQSVESKSIIKWLLTGAAIILVFLIFYFVSTDAPSLTSTSANKTQSNLITNNISYNWWSLLLTLTGIIFLPLCYLAATKKLNKKYKKLSEGYKSFKLKIKSPEEEKDLAINLVIVVTLILFFIGISFNYYGWWDTLSTQLSARLSDPYEPLNLRYILIGIAGVVTLFFAWRRLIIADGQKKAQVKQADAQFRQVEIEYERRLNERFDNAAGTLSKQLNESSFHSHSGAIYSLRALAIDDYKNTQRCLDIICSCNEWMEEYIDEFVEKKRDNDPYNSWLLKEDNRIANKNNGSEITLLHEKRSQEGLVAISYILKEISTNNPEKLQTLDFRNKMLCGISLNNLTLDNIDFQDTYLVAASLIKISLKKAKLNRANLQGVTLWNAEMERASLDNAHFERASLSGVFMDGASLSGAHLDGASLTNTYMVGASLADAHLNRAFLTSTQMDGAYLKGAHMAEAFLVHTHLRGASLENVHLEGALLIDTRFFGTRMDNVDLSNAMLLSCDLYGTTLKNIKSKNIIFNDTVKTGYIKNKDTRKKWLDFISQHITMLGIESFRQQIETASLAIEKNQEPDGLDIIRNNSIVTKDNNGMYDISDEHLADIKNRLQGMLNEKNLMDFLSMRSFIELLDIKDKRNIYRTTEISNESERINRSINLVNKLLALINQLIRSSRV